MTRTQVTGRRSPCTVTRPGPGAAARHRRRVPATGSARRRVPEGLHSSCRLTLLSHGTASRGIRIPATGSGCRWTGAARRRRIPGPRPARWTRRRGPGVAARPPWDPLRPPGAAARNRITGKTALFGPAATRRRGAVCSGIRRRAPPHGAGSRNRRADSRLPRGAARYRVTRARALPSLCRTRRRIASPCGGAGSRSLHRAHHETRFGTGSRFEFGIAEPFTCAPVPDTVPDPVPDHVSQCGTCRCFRFQNLSTQAN